MVHIIDYIKESKREMLKVNWPTSRQTFISTSVVIVLSLIVAFYLGALDYVFQIVISKFFF
jgi:preprotein translocase SecE subunit